jgi:hypothetical protein
MVLPVRVTPRYLALLFGGAAGVVALMCFAASLWDVNPVAGASPVLALGAAKAVATLTDLAPKERSPDLARRDRRAWAILAGFVITLTLIGLIGSAIS